MIVAVILLLLLLLLWQRGYGPGGSKCVVPPTIVEKIVEKEKLVDNPTHLNRIGELEKENSSIPELKSKIVNLENAEPKVITKVVTKEVEKVVDNPALIERITRLEKENQLIDSLRERVKELESIKPVPLMAPESSVAPVAPAAPSQSSPVAPTPPVTPPTPGMQNTTEPMTPPVN
jgi:hypothetical protein